MKQTNKVFENTAEQIKCTTEILKAAEFVIFNLPPQRNMLPQYQQLTWSSNVSGRMVSGKAFTTIDQYLAILSSNSYQLLLKDYSLVRYSFQFDGPNLMCQNLLWWPCPIKMDGDTENEFGLVEGIKYKINAINNQADFIMRSPVRVDFDAANDNEYHPRAHTHFEHSECRINSVEPICFNRFLKFIITNFYPESQFLCKKFRFLSYQYSDRHKTINYDNSTKLTF